MAIINLRHATVPGIALKPHRRETATCPSRRRFPSEKRVAFPQPIPHRPRVSAAAVNRAGCGGIHQEYRNFLANHGENAAPARRADGGLLHHQGRRHGGGALQVEELSAKRCGGKSRYRRLAAHTRVCNSQSQFASSTATHPARRPSILRAENFPGLQRGSRSISTVTA